MPVSERTLRSWRKEALKTARQEMPNWRVHEIAELSSEGKERCLENYIKELSRRILLLTQELMDQHLVKEMK